MNADITDIDIKKFTNAHNQLAFAAENLLLLATQLHQQSQAPQLSKLYDTTCDEIITFEAQAAKAGYNKTTINQARFLLCELIDEIILSSDWGAQSDWKRKNLVNAFQKEDVSESRFFHILEEAEEVPEDHIDLLELGYLCLNLGYRGIYHNHQNELTTLISRLHKVIQHERSDTKKPTQWHLPPIWLTILVSAFLLLAIFIPYNKKLNNDVQPVLQAIQQISTSDT